MEEGVLYLFHDSQDDMKKTINWLTAVLFLALPALATLVIVHVIYTLFGHFYNEKETLLYFIVSQLSVLATVFAFRNIQSMAFMNLPKLRLRPTMISIALGLAVWAMAAILYTFAYPGAHPRIRNNYALCLSVMFFLVSPIVEEMFFRGWMLCYMESKSFSKPTIILTISTMFYLYHWTPVIPFYSCLDTFALSVLTCCMFFKTRDIRYCILMHFVLNFMNSLIAFIPYLIS